jgi:hypothetical protein
MKRLTQKNSILVFALLSAMIAGEAPAADIRFINSGDYLEPSGWQGGIIPGTNDTARFNWGNNTVTLAGEAPLLRNFQMGVDESGQLVVNAGGKLKTTGTQNSTVGNNGGVGVIGRLTVNAGGEVNVTNVLFVGATATGILTNDGGTLTISSHLWGGSGGVGVGTISIRNGGVISVGGNIGLGTINASDPSGGKCSLYVEEGGVLNLANISPVTSIQPNSVLDISGSGVVIIPGDRVAVMSAYTNALRITAYGGLGTVGIDYNNMNAGKTTLFAIAPLQPPPAQTVWNPAANPSGTGKWNEKTNWTGFVAPGTVTKVIFNVVGAIPCTVTEAAVADYVVMGDNGPGGTLIITNGGSLTCGAVNATAIGYNSNALMVVESGGSASFGTHLWIGLDPGSDGKLTMNGGTVSVGGMFGLGWQGGKGTAQITGGTLELAQWDDANSIQGGSVLDVSGLGKVVINGNHQASVNDYILSGAITNHAGPGMLLVDYNNIYVGKTTIYPSGVYLPPAQATWNPVLAFPNVDGLWNVSSNWSGGITPSNVTFVYFNVFDAIPCTITNAAFASVARIGLNGPGGTLIITNGGNLVCSHPEEWNSIGMNNTGLLVVENGGSASYGQHLWIGFEPGADGTLIMNGGTVSVGGMFGLGWNGGTGHANINGGTLNLNQWHPTDSIKGTSVLNVAGTAKVVINGNWFTSVSNYVSAGKITANGGPNVFYFYDPNSNKTIISAVLLPAPRQSITAISVSGGNVSITYQTTHQHTYYIQATPSLSPAVWTPVPGSTNAATGAPVTFTFPAAPGPMFFRTVSQ